jgi:phosphatidylglycerophosphate synthase
MALTRRPLAEPPLDRDAYLRRWSELHGGYDPRSSRFVAPVLAGAHALVRRPAAWGVTPTALTLLAPVVAAAAVVLATGGPAQRGCAAIVVVASGIADNLDGALAVCTGRESRIGFVLDSLVDRLSDGLWLVALWFAGAAAGPALAGTLLGAAAAMVALEYTRARAGNAGMTEIGVATVAERPTRMLFVAFTLIGTAVAGNHQADVATAGAAVLTAVTLAGCAQLGVAVVRALR